MTWNNFLQKMRPESRNKDVINNYHVEGRNAFKSD